MNIKQIVAFKNLGDLKIIFMLYVADFYYGC